MFHTFIDWMHALFHCSAVIEERKAQQSKLAQSTSSQPAVSKAPVRKVEEKVRL